jgi:predicted transcriptional regulator
MITTIELPQSTMKRLEKIAASSRCTPAALAKQAINERLDYEEWALAQIDAGLADIKAGRTIPHDEFLQQIGIRKHGKKAA